jgi:hypothetical protein
MNPAIGFVLLTHHKPHMIHRLINKLNAMFDHPPIACHHDFSKCDLSVEALPENVSLVQPHVEISWGEFAEVEGTARATQLLYENPATSPDWFVFLSGTDYPIKPAKQILQDLKSSSCDAFIHCELIQAGAFQHAWQELCYSRYCAKDPSFFSSEFKCYAGHQWFCASRRAAEYIIDFHTTQTALAEHYHDTVHASESYFQCVLANAPHLNLNNETWRYIDWSAGGQHPKTLGLNDLPKLLASHAHFARKFDADTAALILDQLDALTS